MEKKGFNELDVDTAHGQDWTFFLTNQQREKGIVLQAG